MKKILVSIFMSVMSAGTATAAGSLWCEGYYQDDISDSDNAKYDFSSTVESNTLLTDGVLTAWTNITGNNDPTESTYEIARVSADAGYMPRNPRYKNMNRFMLTWGWTDLALLVPKDLTKQKKNFRGYLQRIGHDTMPTVSLTCQYSR